MFSVLTPYYREDVLYSMDDLHKENEDGITTLFYLQKIYPGEFYIFTSSIQLLQSFLQILSSSTVYIKDEWKNYEERIKDTKLGYADKDRSDLDRHWVSYRGQTLARTGQILSISFNTKVNIYSYQLFIYTFFFAGSLVRGMMYYREALKLQCFLDFADDNGWWISFSFFSFCN